MRDKIDEIIQTIFDVYRLRGDEAYDGEPVSQLEHAVQSAVRAKQERSGDPEFILAAFLHDFGHIYASPEYPVESMDGYGVWRHEEKGGAVLHALCFSDKVVRLVANHVRAKRYLVSADASYYAQLSDASKITLEKQGGPMTIVEQREFACDPWFELHLNLRRLDEKAKVEGVEVGNLAWLKDLMRDHLSIQMPKLR